MMHKQTMTTAAEQAVTNLLRIGGGLSGVWTRLNFRVHERWERARAARPGHSFEELPAAAKDDFRPGWRKRT